MKRNTFYNDAPPIDSPSITGITHPEYDKNWKDWEEWRLTYEGGTCFLERYLEQFSRRESPTDFKQRKDMTPIPAFAAAAVDEIKNSIFQRAVDITRLGGPKSFVESCKGQLGGVDRKGSTMNFFIGDKILPELLTMKKVGVFIDMPNDIGPSLQSKGQKHPYVYSYRTEDIRTWAEYSENGQREFTAVLLRDYKFKVHPTTKLPSGTETTYRHMHINTDGFVVMDIYDTESRLLSSTISTLQKIPFVTFEITNSLLKNISRYQIALLNLNSSDINYALKSNFPIYVEQRDDRTAPWLRGADDCPTTDEDCNTEIPEKDEAKVGVAHGRAYGKGMDRPGFINPSPEPLKASMDKQKALRDDIRMLVQLNLSTIQSKMASADSKGMDLQGLEAGLSYLGLELENGERKIGEIWSIYEGIDTPTTINYPSRYSLKSSEDIQKETDHLLEVRGKVPSRLFKKEITKKIVSTVLGTSVATDVHDKILREVDKAKAIPEDATQDLKDNLLSIESAIESKGYLPSEKSKAAKDAKVRIKRIADAQTPVKNPAARGLPSDADPNPQSGKSEKQNKPKRGKGK